MEATALLDHLTGMEKNVLFSRINVTARCFKEESSSCHVIIKNSLDKLILSLRRT